MKLWGIVFGFSFLVWVGLGLGAEVGRAEAAGSAPSVTAPETTGAESHCVGAGLDNSQEELRSAFAPDEIQGAMVWLARGACEKDPEGCGVWKMAQVQPIPKPKKVWIAREPEKTRTSEISGNTSAWSFR